METGVSVYLTDGYGDFPNTPLKLPVLWVVTPGDLDVSQFLFGEAVRLLSVEKAIALPLLSRFAL